MKVFGTDKSSRLLKIYSKLVKGCIVNKSEEAANFNVDERTIQRDIAAIKDYMGTDMTNNGVINSIIYDKDAGGYRMKSSYQGTLSNSETLAVCKILLDSRAFPKDVMQEILDKLISCCVPKENRQPVKELIGNEEHHYIELRHKRNFLDTLWDLGQAIRSCRYG